LLGRIKSSQKREYTSGFKKTKYGDLW
jgi:hypothetical protein